MLFDTHTHLDCPDFADDYDEVIQRSIEQGVHQMMLIGVRESDWQRKLALVAKYPGVLYAVLGLHPVFLDAHKRQYVDVLEELLKSTQSDQIYAIGEIGLDYFQKLPNIVMSDKKEQQWYFDAQLQLAQSYHKPVVLHVRKAHDDVLIMLNNFTISKGIAHAFNGSIQQAEKYMEKGFYLGAGGMLTHPHSNKLHNLFKQIPLEYIVLETDAPDLTVYQHKGERNSPEYLPYVAQKLAQIKEISVDEVIRVTTKNAKYCFNLNQ